MDRLGYFAMGGRTTHKTAEKPEDICDNQKKLTDFCSALISGLDVILLAAGLAEPTSITMDCAEIDRWA